jgi:cytochrome c oxidase subunit 2
VSAAGVLALPACSATTKDEWERGAMPRGAANHSDAVIHFWQWSWVTALIIGVFVWGLILFAVLKYRRRHDDEVPVQTRYNLPMELLYTIAPVIVVLVYFKFVISTQEAVLSGSDEDGKPDHVVTVVGQQWSWTFNYGLGQQDPSANDDATDDKFPYASYVHESGTGSYIPNLYLPVNETTRFNLHSPDVIHDLGVPAFIMRMDVVPGRVNHYEVTPTEIGVYKGKCYELCGVYHQRMLFNVHVVSQADYQQYLQRLQADSGKTDQPLLGGAYATTQAGLAGDDDEEGSQK